MKKRFASHFIVFTVTEQKTRYVVELEEGCVTDTFPLEEEIAFTEWIGGIIVLTPHREVKPNVLQLPASVESVIENLTAPAIGKQTYAWHITPEDAVSGQVHHLRRLV